MFCVLYVLQQALLHGQPARAQPHQPLGQPPPQPQPQLQSEPAQAVGSATGATSSRNQDPDEIRRRRVCFLFIKTSFEN